MTALAAAQSKRDAAAPEAAYELLAIAELGPLTELQQAQIARMRAQMELVRSRGGEAGALTTGESAARLLDAATGLDGLDDDLARETYLEALAAAMYAGRLAEPGQLANIAKAAAAAVNRVPELQRPIDFLLSGMARRILDGPGAGSGHLRTALERWGDYAHSDAGRPVVWPFPIAQESAAHELWDDAVRQQISGDTLRRARETGALAVLPPALVYRAGVHVYRGELITAARLIEESNAIATSTGYLQPKYHSLNALPRFEERACAGGNDWGLGAVASARALLASNDDAEALFTEAIELLERANIVLHLARARLSYGEWLRRVNRRIDARQDGCSGLRGTGQARVDRHRRKGPQAEGRLW